MLPRLHLPATQAGACAGGRCTLTDEQAHYLQRVLRLRDGEGLELFDGEGRRCPARLVENGRRQCVIELDAGGWRIAHAAAAPLSVVLLQGISTADKMDWTIEKAVELGVDVIMPVTAERSLVRLDAARAQRRHDHWRRLAIAACMQCRRDRLPQLMEALPMTRALQAADTLAPGTRLSRLLLHPPGDAVPAQPISRWMPASDAGSPLRVIVAAGPESGWAQAEVSMMLDAGFEAVCLGPRILRTETAALAAVAALQARFGEF